MIVSRRGAGSKSIPLKAIRGVEFKKGGLKIGYIRFDTGASLGQQGVLTNKTQLLLRDPNTVAFQWRRNADFEQLAEKVNAAIYA